MTAALLILLTGIGATAFIDCWAMARRALFGAKLPDYGLVGRWLAAMMQGRFRHESISRAPPVRGERVIGWAAHYLTGVGFASLLPLICGKRWLLGPTLLPAVAVGLATVAAPFLIMQPGMGAGIAACRTSRPWPARMQSLVTHTLFGLGLFLSATTIQLLTRGE